MFADQSKALRRWPRWYGRLALALALLAACGVLPLCPQKGGQSGTQLPQSGPPPDFRDDKAPNYGPLTPRTPTFQDMQYRRYVESRLRSMVSDADKLLKLAEQLNKETDSSMASSFSPKDVHTVNQIEKLAHSVKWKMQLVVDQVQTH